MSLARLALLGLALALAAARGAGAEVGETPADQS